MPNVQHITPDLIEIDQAVRAEKGYARLTATATSELLDSLQGRYADGGRDAMGATIVLGQPMTYLDYFGDKVWWVYKWEPRPTVEGEAVTDPPQMYWAEKSHHPSEAEAVAAAVALL